MDSGAEDRSRLRLHVRAAREWLGRAEESLGRAEDVRGDLNLMLAQAELARAKEMERPGASVVWTRRLAPFFVAALIAGGGYSLWRFGTQTVPAPLPPVGNTERSLTTSAQPETVALPVLPAQTEYAEQTRLTALPEITEPPVREEEPPEAVSVAELEPPEMVEAMEMPETAQESTQQARLPSEDMQRLMSSAGQSLRAIQ